jgi:hypothetical protein
VKKAKALHPVAKPKPHHGKKKGPHHPAAPPHSTGAPVSISAPLHPAHHQKPGKPHHAKRPKRPKTRRPVRKLASPGLLVACCSAEAVAMSLRLAGQRVSDDEVVNLYRLTGAGDDDGASIAATLEAAAVLGLGLVEYEPLIMAGAGRVACGPLAALGRAGEWHGRVAVTALAADEHVEHSLILGLDLPEGPHAVYATSAGWWSWGELYPPSAFAGAVIDEAWAVTWS